MDAFYSMAGQLIEFYRQQRKNEDERFNVKLFCMDEDGNNICSFPTYKKIAAGAAVKNEGFYYFLANRLGIPFDVPSSFDETFIEEFETHLIEAVEKHEVSQIRYFYHYYIERFQELNSCLVIRELYECLHLVSCVCLDESGSFNEEKCLALIAVSQNPKFIIAIYSLLYRYYMYTDIKINKCNEIAQMAVKVECDSFDYHIFEAIYQRDIVKDSNKSLEIVGQLDPSLGIYNRYAIEVTKYCVPPKLSPEQISYNFESLLAFMTDYNDFFTRSEFRYIRLLCACYDYRLGKYKEVIEHAKNNMLIRTNSYVFSLILLISSIHQLGDSPDPDLFRLFNQEDFTSFSGASLVQEYFEQRMIKKNLLKAENQIINHLMPYYCVDCPHHLSAYLFYKELEVLVKQTGHEHLLSTYKDFAKKHDISF